jgi:hypothetical protein
MKKATNPLIVLAILIATLALAVAGLGVFWQGEGQPFEFHTLHGETIAMQGHGLYRFDTVSFAAQGIAQDFITLMVGLPFLAVGMVLFRKRRIKGRLILAGTLAYFLYTYASFSFGAAYNVVFLAYVALFSLSLFAFILALMQIDIPALPSHFSPSLPRRVIAIFLFVVGGFLLFAWLGRIIPGLLKNRPPVGLESYTTLVIQTLDLGLIMPTAFLSGILLWKRRPWGYLLASIVLIKGATMLLAVSAMIANMIRAGAQVSIGESIMFPIFALIDIGMTVVLLKNVSETMKASV